MSIVRQLEVFIHLTLLLCAVNSAAQIEYRKFTVDDGIEGYNRFVINQDSLGGLWMATDEGLFKYNNGVFDRFQYIKTDSIYKSEKIQYAECDANDNYVISTISDVRIFNPYTLESKIVFPKPVGKIISYDSCTILVEDDKYYRLNNKNHMVDSLDQRYKAFNHIDSTLFLCDYEDQVYKTLDGIHIEPTNEITCKGFSNKFNITGGHYYANNFTKVLTYNYNEHSDTISYKELGLIHVHKIYSFDNYSCWMHTNDGLCYILFQNQIFDPLIGGQFISGRHIWRDEDRVRFSGESAIGYIKEKGYNRRKSRYTVMDAVPLNQDSTLVVLSNQFVGILNKRDSVKIVHKLNTSNTDNAGLCIQVLKNNKYLVGTLGGLYLFDFEKISSTEIPLEGYEDIAIYDIAALNHDTYILGTALGTLRYEYSSERIRPLFPEFKVPIYDIRVYDDEIILSTNGAGVIIADTFFNIKHHINTDDGLSHQETYATYRVGNEKYISSTRYGISIYDTDLSEYYIYTHASGLPFNEFNRNSHFLDTITNSIYLGGVGGLIQIYLDDLSPPFQKTETGISSIVHVDGDRKRRLPYGAFMQKPGFHLQENERLSILLSHPSYLARQHTQYRYAINDDIYTSLGSGNNINIKNLEEGNNVIKIQSRAFHEPWTTSSKELFIKYTPVLYKRRWFTFLLIASGLGLIYLVYRYRLNLLKQKAKKLAEQKKAIWNSIEKEKKSISSRLHDDVGQQLVALKINASSENNEKLSKELDVVLERLRKATKDIYPYDLSIGINAALQAMANRINARTNVYFSVDVHGLENKITSNQALLIYRIIQEAWTNTLKHSGANSARVTYDETDHAIIIQDNGIGLSEKISIGIGLASLEDKVSLLGGSYSIYNDDGFVIKIKLDQISRHHGL